MLLGAGVGASSVAVPVYVAETAPAALRGALGSVTQLAVTVGILLAYGPTGRVVVLDYEKYKNEHELHFVTTRDIQVEPKEFPFRNVATPRERDLSLFSKSFSGELTRSQDGHPRLRETEFWKATVTRSIEPRSIGHPG